MHKTPSIDSNKKEECEEIQRRMQYLKNTANISVTEKIAIVKRVLEVIENDRTENETVQ